MTEEISRKPKGTLAIQTLAMPADTNANGDIFGGWLVSQMDLASSIAAKQRAKTRVVTVAIDSMVFHQPVQIGDIVCCYAEIIKVGRTSMTINTEVWTLGARDGLLRHVTEGVFTFVAIDEHGRPTPVSR
ncbi:MAG: acyl-CoA thioesterase [Gammaproteobacteria bacterium]